MTEGKVDEMVFGCRYRGDEGHAARGPLYQGETPRYTRAVYTPTSRTMAKIFTSRRISAGFPRVFRAVVI